MEGIEKVLSNLQNIKTKIDNAIYKVVVETSLQVEADVKKSMKGGASGKYHSSPGEPPYVQTGNLRDNVVIELPKLIQGQEITGKVGVRDSVRYAPALEFGYPGRNLEERPFLRPALARNMSKFKDNLKDAVASIK